MHTRKQATTLRIVRDTRIARDIKELYSYQCQVCGIAIKTKKGVYAEGAHIKPLGRPHNGYDSTDNILCLCPNHHVMLDKGSFAIDDSFNLIGELSGLVNIHAKHTIDLDNLKEKITVLDEDIQKVSDLLVKLEKDKANALATMNALQGAKSQCVTFIKELHDDNDQSNGSSDDS
mgnify:CR=1 FL=1